jgi:K+ transporter
MVILATIATSEQLTRQTPLTSNRTTNVLIRLVIASQAIITGCFSLLSQATSLGFCPPLRLEHTSETMFGQIYVSVSCLPATNLVYSPVFVSLS